MPEVTLRDFADSFGTTVEDIPDVCRQYIAKTDFKYRIIDSAERDRVILDVLKSIEADQQVIGAKEREYVWERGWKENFKEFVESNYNLAKLTPKFIRPGQVMRLNRNYVLPSNHNFELDYFHVFRLWLFNKYLKDFGAIYDFGCGTGFNLIAIAQLYPQKRLYGLDFVSVSKDIVNKLAEIYKWQMKGYIFDMRSPKDNFEIEENSVVFTSGSIEQLAGEFEPFLQFLLKYRPALCINIEPTIELYDKDNLLDYLAIKFHKKRGYTENYFSHLKQLEEENKVEIIKAKRLFFGSLLMEGFTYLIWRPR